MNLIDKDAAIKHLDKMLEKYPKNYYVFSIIDFINTLEVKVADLDYIKKELDEFIRFNKPNVDFGWGTLYNVATHFFELGLKAQKGE